MTTLTPEDDDSPKPTGSDRESCSRWSWLKRRGRKQMHLGDTKITDFPEDPNVSESLRAAIEAIPDEYKTARGYLLHLLKQPGGFGVTMNLLERVEQQGREVMLDGAEAVAAGRQAGKGLDRRRLLKGIGSIGGGLLGLYHTKLEVDAINAQASLDKISKTNTLGPFDTVYPMVEGLLSFAAFTYGINSLSRPEPYTLEDETGEMKKARKHYTNAMVSELAPLVENLLRAYREKTGLSAPPGR